MKHCKNLLWCPCFLEGVEQFHSCFLETAEQFHFCFLEGGGTVPLAEQFHFYFSSLQHFEEFVLFFPIIIMKDQKVYLDLIATLIENKRILAILALININGGTVPLLLLERMAEQFHFCFQQVWRNSSTFAFQQEWRNSSTLALLLTID